MNGNIGKYALLLAGASALVAAGGYGQDQLDQYRQKLTQLPTQPASDAIANAVSEWKQLQQSDSYPFDRYAQFLLAHPGWPGETGRRRAAERMIDPASGSPGLAASYFRRFPPLTATGAVRFEIGRASCRERV